MIPPDRLTRLMNHAARQLVPDEPDLWPAIAQRITTRQRRGTLTLATAALLIVMAAGALMLLALRGSDSSGPQASLIRVGSPTPTAIPPQPLDTPAPELIPSLVLTEAWPDVVTVTPAPLVSPAWPDVVTVTPAPLMSPPAGEAWPDVITVTPASLMPPPTVQVWPDVVTATQAQFETQQGFAWPIVTFIESQNIPDGRFSDTQILTRDLPRRDYALLSMPEDVLDSAGGWVIARVQGDYFTPNLYAEQVPSYAWIVDGPAFFYTNDGAVLFNWLYGLTQPNTAGYYNPISYNLIVDGNLTTLQGNYTLDILPFEDVITVADTPETVVISRQPQTLSYEAPEGEGQSLRLIIDVEQAQAGPDIPVPDIALILPHGHTLTRFNPAQTPHLEINFSALPADQQLILANPLDVCPRAMPLDECQAAPRPDITLSVSVEPVIEAATGALSNEIPRDKVAVAIPEGAYLVSGGLNTQDLPGQTVDVHLVFTQFNDLDGGTGQPGDFMDVDIRDQLLIEDALVVEISDTPPHALVLAVGQQDAVTLAWCIDAGLPIILKPAE